MEKAVEVLVTLPLSAELLSRLQSVSPRVRVTAQSGANIPAEAWERCEVLFTARTLPTPEQAPNLKWIQSYFAGVDSMLDTPIFQKPGIRITTLSGAAASQMAEYAVMMMLALGHRLPAMSEAQRKKDWPRDRWERFSPRELRDATVGIVGYGSIGRQVARLLQPFGAVVLACKREAMHPEDRGYTREGWGDPTGDLVQRLYPSQAIRSMVKTCDFVVITAPLTAQTRNLINASVLAAMKPGAFLVDVSRGGIVNHEALVKAVQEGRLGGAALDVFPEEPLPADSPLWSLPNVIITPHISGNSAAYDARAVELFTENLRRYIEGLPLHNLLDPQRGY
ncbi:MAG: D-2-hydroxyacid dehydrogenase [Anaerolineales bacterium]